MKAMMQDVSVVDRDQDSSSLVSEHTPKSRLLAQLIREAELNPVEGDWDIKPHAVVAAAAPTRQHFTDSEPVVLMRNPMAGQQVIESCCDMSEPVPFNIDQPVSVDTDLFQGFVSLQIRGLASSNNKYFDGKKRFSHGCIQGRFKHDVRASDLWTGQECVQDSDLLPTSFFNVLYTTAAKLFSSTTRVCPSSSDGQVAGFMNPVLASFQLVHVAKPGEEPADMWEAQEDARLLSPELADHNGNPLPADKRRRWFDNPANASQVVLSKDYVHTFMTWQHYCNFATYKLHISSFFGLDICNVCEGQPVQVMMKDVETGEYCLNVVVWHRRMLYKEQDSSSIQNSINSLTSSFKSFRGKLLKVKN